MSIARPLQACLALCLVVAPLRAERIQVGGGALDVTIRGDAALGSRALVDWIRGAATAVTAYFGKFPLAELEVSVVVDGRSGPHGGVTNGWPAPNIRVRVGRDTGASELARDWVMVHEMCHTAFPNVDPEHQRWAEEGLSTYVEPLARHRAGQYSREQLWLDLARGLPQGLPAAGDRGLDNTPTWGRTYWGGALFWLLADVGIREKTAGRLGLEDALRGILAAGGDIRVDWPLDRALAVGDRAVGVSVLVPLHREMGASATPVDLGALWGRLGVRVTDRVVTFDDTAPQANLRRAIEGN